jgi:hypothetical protein
MWRQVYIRTPSEPERKVALKLNIRAFGTYQGVQKSVHDLDWIPRLLERAFIKTCDLGRNE